LLARAQDGALSYSEFEAALREQEPLSDREIRDCFNAIDQDGTGSIQFSEFIAAAMDQSTIDDKQIEAAFKRLDVRNTGTLDEEGLQQLMGDTHSDISVGSILSAVDDDDDGQISLPEFKRAMRRMSSMSDLLSPARQNAVSRTSGK
jgi:Ca2+-binding EF-hand superfamily protein